MGVAGSANVDRRDQYVAGVLALSDTGVARGTTQQAMWFVMEFAVAQPARRDVRRDDLPISDRGRRLRSNWRNLVAVAAAAGGFASPIRLLVCLLAPR